MKDEHRFFDCIAGVVLAGIMVLGFGLLPQTAQAAEVKELARDAGQPERQIEVQAEYLDGRFFKDRNVDLYAVHVYQPYKKVHAMTMSYGMTLERAMGSIYWKDRTRDAGAFGLGPSYMLRFTRSLSPRWDISLDGTGSLLFYDHSHPDGGRGYGFLWRREPWVHLPPFVERHEDAQPRLQRHRVLAWVYACVLSLGILSHREEDKRCFLFSLPGCSRT